MSGQAKGTGSGRTSNKGSRAARQRELHSTNETGVARPICLPPSPPSHVNLGRTIACTLVRDPRSARKGVSRSGWAGNARNGRSRRVRSVCIPDEALGAVRLRRNRKRPSASLVNEYLHRL